MKILSHILHGIFTYNEPQEHSRILNFSKTFIYKLTHRERVLKEEGREFITEEGREWKMNEFEEIYAQVCPW